VFLFFCLVPNLDFHISNEAMAIAACESGDTKNLGSLDWDAVGYNGNWSTDGGAFQFNDYWIWNPKDRWVLAPVANNVFNMHSDDFVRQWPNAQSAPPNVQYAVFEYVWNDGYGWRNWTASKACWDKWLTIDKKGRAVWRN
jgi:hypothetical protein